MALKLIQPGQRKGNPYFLAVGWHKGKYVEKSLKTADPEEAETRFLELQLELRKGGGTAAGMTFREACHLYLESHPHLSADFRKCVGALEAELGDRQAATIVTSDFVQAARRLKPKAKPQTWNTSIMTPGAAVLHCAAENGHIPWVRIKRFKEPAPEPKALNKDQAAVLLGTATGLERVFLLLLFKHGWRISEALALQWTHIDVKNQNVRRRISKDDEWKTMPLQREVLEALLEEVPRDRRVGRVFPWVIRQNVYRWLKPLCQRLGFHFTPHMARHSAATWAANEGYTTLDLMAAFGWKDHKSVKRYGVVNPERVRAMLNRGK